MPLTVQQLEQIKSDLAVHPFGFLQDSGALILTLMRKGWEVTDFFEYLEYERVRTVKARKRHMAAMQQFTAASPQCDSDANHGHMVLRPDPDCPDSGCYWVCPRCRYSRYVNASAIDERNRIMEVYSNADTER